jgi:hypothetical protein
MYGDDGPDGPRTVLNTKVFMEFKYDLFNWYQKHDKQVPHAIYADWAVADSMRSCNSTSVVS